MWLKMLFASQLSASINYAKSNHKWINCLGIERGITSIFIFVADPDDPMRLKIRFV
jgi:hypothetical protein